MNNKDLFKTLDFLYSKFKDKPKVLMLECVRLGEKMKEEQFKLGWDIMLKNMHPEKIKPINVKTITKEENTDTKKEDSK